MALHGRHDSKKKREPLGRVSQLQLSSACNSDPGLALFPVEVLGARFQYRGRPVYVQKPPVNAASFIGHPGGDMRNFRNKS